MSKDRYEAMHLKDRSDTIIYDTKHEEPILSLPRFGFEMIFHAMNKNCLSDSKIDKLKEKIEEINKKNDN